MAKMRLNKSVLINAPKAQIWPVLTEDHLTRQWYAAFSPGTHAITDWQPGSKALFKDDTQSGMAGVILVHDPLSEISLEYRGIITDGKEDYESDEAVQFNGYFESYKLYEDAGKIRLEIICDISSEYLEIISEAWDHALEMIRVLAETQTTKIMDTRQLLLELDQSEHDFYAILASFEPEQINVVPFTGSWTAGQVAEHILLSESGIPETLLGSTAPTERPVAQFVPVIESIFLDFTAHYQSPDFIIPSPGPHDHEELLKAFKTNRAGIRNLAATIDLSLTCTDFAFPQIAELTRWEWLQFVLCHSQRHTRQLRNIFEKVAEQVEG